MSDKKNVSVRMHISDLRRIKEISKRVNVKESDIFRFAVRSTMNKLMPLLDRNLKGAEFLLALMDCGEELVNYFSFDAHQLMKIISFNEKTDDLDIEDVHLVAIAAANPDYLATKLTEKLQRPIEGLTAFTELRSYLHQKYSHAERDGSKASGF